MVPATIDDDAAETGENDQAGFEKPRRRKNRRKGKDGPASERRFEEVLEERRGTLERTGWLDEARRWLKESLVEANISTDSVDTIVCLGLGSFASSPSEENVTPSGLRKSQYQLVMLLDVVVAVFEERGDRPRVVAYDPAFSQADREFFVSQRIECPDTDPPLAGTTASTTVYYMPHAPRSLYESLLVQNGLTDPCTVRSSPNPPPRPSNLFVIGNTFSTYADEVRREVRDRIPALLYWGPKMEQVQVPVDDKVEKAIGNDVFNETSAQWVRTVRAPRPPRPRPASGREIGEDKGGGAGEEEGLDKAMDQIRLGPNP